MAAHEPPARRIAVNCRIPGLRHEVVSAYVELLMRLAGADLLIIEPAAIEAVPWQATPSRDRSTASPTMR